MPEDNGFVHIKDIYDLTDTDITTEEGHMAAVPAISSPSATRTNLLQVRDATRGKVSVIIPHAKRESLGNTINSIVAQDYPEELVEVIVVGQFSEAFRREWPKVNTIDTGMPVTPGRARNLGAAHSSGEVLIFLDDDCEADANWIRENLKELDRINVGVVGGIVEGKSSGFIARAVDFANFGSCQGGSREERPVCSASLAIRKELFDKVGGFDEGMRVHEDIDLCHRADLAGFTAVYQPQVRILHDHGRTHAGSMLSYMYFGGKAAGLETERKYQDLSDFYRRLLWFRNPFLYAFAALPFALGATGKTVIHNFREHRIVLLLSPAIFLAKLGCHVGIAHSLASTWISKSWRRYGVLQNARRLFEYSVLKSFFRNPRVLTLAVTSQCNAKCGHCFYWQELNQPDDLSFDEIQKLSNSLGKLDKLLITGGEPFLRRDLPEILNLFFQNNDLNMVNIPTNGLLPDLTQRQTRRILEVADGRTINVTFSLDGLEEVHDELRGVPGNFAKVVESYEALHSLQDEYANLSLRINSVVMNRTIGSVFGLIDRIPKLFSQINTPALTLLRGGPMDTTLLLPPTRELAKLYRYKARNIPGKQPLLFRIGDWTTFNLGLQTLREDTQVVSCEAGRILGVVEANGNVKHCELLPPIGNLRDGDFQAIWTSEGARHERQKISDKQCRCTHECNIFPSLLAHPIQGAKALAKASVAGDE